MKSVPAGAERDDPAASVPPVDPLKYQATSSGCGGKSLGQFASPEMLTVKLRYKEPEGETSKLMERPFVDSGAQFRKRGAGPEVRARPWPSLE